MQYTGAFTPPKYEAGPEYQAPAAFQAPTMDQALADPGYQFALKQGTDALQNSQAARQGQPSASRIRNSAAL